MLTADIINKRAKKKRIYSSSSSNQEHAIRLAERTIDRIPPNCFSLLNNPGSKLCKRCTIKEYCQYVQKYQKFDGVVLRESVDDPILWHGFKDGSRPYKLLMRWYNKTLTRKDLEGLSKEMFNVIINMDDMLQKLKQKSLLRKQGKLLGINWKRND